MSTADGKLDIFFVFCFFKFKPMSNKHTSMLNDCMNKELVKIVKCLMMVTERQIYGELKISNLFRRIVIQQEHSLVGIVMLYCTLTKRMGKKVTLYITGWYGTNIFPQVAFSNCTKNILILKCCNPIHSLKYSEIHLKRKTMECI